MKVLNKPVDMIAVFYSSGRVEPVKFKYEDTPVTVDRVLKRYSEKLAGNRRICFVCINEGAKVYELKYEVDTQVWYLFKM